MKLLLSETKLKNQGTLNAAFSSELKSSIPLYVRSIESGGGGGGRANVMIVLSSVLWASFTPCSYKRSFNWSWYDFNKSFSRHIYTPMPILLTIQLFGFRWLKVRKHYRMRLCSIILRNHLMKSCLLSWCQGSSSHSGHLVLWLQFQSCHHLMTSSKVYW